MTWFVQNECNQRNASLFTAEYHDCFLANNVVVVDYYSFSFFLCLALVFTVVNNKACSALKLLLLNYLISVVQFLLGISFVFFSSPFRKKSLLIFVHFSFYYYWFTILLYIYVFGWMRCVWVFYLFLCLFSYALHIFIIHLYNSSFFISYFLLTHILGCWLCYFLFKTSASGEIKRKYTLTLYVKLAHIQFLMHNQTNDEEQEVNNHKSVLWMM